MVARIDTAYQFVVANVRTEPPQIAAYVQKIQERQTYLFEWAEPVPGEHEVWPAS